MPKTQIQAAAEGMPKSTVLSFSASTGTKEQREAELTDLIADMVNMSSVLSSLLEDRMRDTGKGSFSVCRKDARDIEFVAERVSDYAVRVRQAWEAI